MRPLLSGVEKNLMQHCNIHKDRRNKGGGGWGYYRPPPSFWFLLINLPLQILVRIEAKPFSYKDLGLLLAPPDFKTFLRPYSPYSLTQLDTQWTISLVLIAFAFTYVNAFIARKSSLTFLCETEKIFICISVFFCNKQ